MGSSGGNNSGLISRSDGTVGVGNQAGHMDGSSSIGSGDSRDGSSDGRGSSDGGSSCNNRGSSSVDSTTSIGSLILGSKVLSSGSNNSRLISRGHSAIGVGNQAGDMDGTSITVSRSISSSSDGSSGNRSSGIGSSRSIQTSSIGSLSLGSKVLSSGSNDSRLISRGHSTIGVGNKAGDMDGASSITMVGRGITITSSIGIITISSTVDRVASSKLGGQMVSLGSSNCRLINGGDGTVGVGLKSKKALGADGRQTSGENLKRIVLYICPVIKIMIQKVVAN